MKKLVTTGLTSHSFALAIFLALAVFIPEVSIGQGCVMTCPPNFPPVPVSVSSDCQDTLTFDEIGVTINGCIGEIVVDIMENGVSLGNVISIGMAGNTYMVIISNPASGQSCMAVILVVDDQAPIVICPDDITLDCTADLDLYNGISQDDISDCSPTVVTFNDILLSSGNCEDDIISQFGRTYFITDTFGNVDSCEQLISLQKASLDSVVFPPNLTGADALICFPPPDTTPANTGIPSIGGNPILNGSFCNLSIVRNDIVVPLCAGTYKIFRTWTVYDWCLGNTSIDSTQIIEVTDTTAPVVQAPADMTISTSAQVCTADVTIPSALISDDCSSTFTVRTQGSFGTINSNGGFVQGLPVGVQTIIFIATNGCGLEGSDTMFITIADLQPPVPVCNQSIAIPLNNIGTALVQASAFNAASQDNCGDVYFKVKRMSLPVGYTCANPGNPTNQFDDFIQFCCEDIANNEIMVILRVYDLPPVPGPVSDSYLQGHYNDCMVQVEVQDKLPPQITCPSNLTISCEFPFTSENLAVFGNVVLNADDQEQICIDDPGVPGNPGLQCIGIDGLALDNCNVDISTSAIINVNNCGVGSITRTFIATDDGGLQSSCQQVITITNFDLFDLSDIAFPLDYTTSNVCDIDSLDPEDLSPPFNEPILNEGICDLVGASYTDMVFDFSNEDQACFKILRTWTVIDWCQLNTPTVGIWSHIQVIKVMNNVAPVIVPIEDLTECSFDANCGGLTLDFFAAATDDCSGAASLSWRYSIDIDNNGTFDFISGILTGSTIEFSRNIPVGSHRILYTVWDQCGNTTNEEQLVTVQSCKAPSAKCIYGLSTNLMAMDLNGDGTADWGMVNIQAEMFDAGSDHPCGNAVTVAFSADPLDVTKVFDCSDLGANEIELWAIDENGLTDFCITTIDIQDNNSICPPGQGNTGVISGNINVPGAGKLAGAMVHLDGSNLEEILSGSHGYFVFPSMPFGGQYEVRPVREGDDKNGVTTLDLVKIQKHLLGIEFFSSPFQYIAADANNSQTITAIDIIQFRKLILGYYAELPNNQSWRFIDNAHIFPDPASPWASQWQETYVINPFTNSMNDVNFDAVKIGDLNLSANLQAGSGILLPRTGKSCDVEYAIIPQAENDIYKVEISLLDARQYNALQFSFDWDQNSFNVIDWSAGSGISTDDIRMPQLPGQSASLATYTMQGWQDESQILLTMWVQKKSTNAGSFKLFLKPSPTEPAAYAVLNDEPFKVALLRKQVEVSQVYNRPNPFKDRTSILYVSDREEKGKLQFFDTNGKLVYSRSIQLSIGENEFFVNRTDLRNAGIYVYKIESAFQYSTNRMIIVE